MNANVDKSDKSNTSKIRAVGMILAIAFIGPVTGLLLSALRLVFAPPWTPFTSLIYVFTPFLGLVLGGIALLAKWISVRVLLVALAGMGFGCILYLMLLGPWIPGGMTNCEPAAAALPSVRYNCVSTSSDDPDYEYKFIIEGRAGWPVMQLANPEP